MEFHDIFARHRFDIGVNTEFKVQLTPLDNRPAYSQRLPTLINLKDGIIVELALLHKYGIITTLPFSKYWDEEIFDQDKLGYKDTYNKPNNQIECDDLITDA